GAAQLHGCQQSAELALTLPTFLTTGRGRPPRIRLYTRPFFLRMWTVASRDLKGAAARAGIALYRLPAAASISPVRLSRLLNEHEPLTEREQSRIAEAIERLA